MAATKKTKQKQNFLIRIVFIIFVGYMIASLINLQKDLIAGKKQLEEINQVNSTLVLSNQELEGLLASGTEKDFVERAAKDKLQYVYPGEKIFEATK